jgi:hypothetical protein
MFSLVSIGNRYIKVGNLHAELKFTHFTLIPCQNYHIRRTPYLYYFNLLLSNNRLKKVKNHGLF